MATWKQLWLSMIQTVDLLTEADVLYHLRAQFLLIRSQPVRLVLVSNLIIIKITDPIAPVTMAISRQAETVQLMPFKVNAYPNPTEHYFTLNVQSDNLNEKVEIKVHDILGRQVYITSGAANKN